MIAATAGGRYACAKPNVQNPPRDISFRQLFEAEPGRVLVAADFSQIELRVAALLSKDKAMLDAYGRGMDLHRMTAAAVAGTSPEQVTSEQRSAAKPVSFGNLYQQRPRGLSRYARTSFGVEMSLEEAKDAQDAFFRTYPDLHSWQRKQIQTAAVYRHVESRLGLVRDFNIREGYLAAEACNHPIQASAGEVLMASIARLPDELKGVDARVYNHIHDEIVLDVAEHDAKKAKGALREAMVKGFLEIFP